METKEFNQLSSEHFGVKAGTKFKTVKFHHEVQGDLEKGVELILDSIAHFPTRYLFKDENDNLWTLPIHSVQELSNGKENLEDSSLDESSSEKIQENVQEDRINEKVSTETSKNEPTK